MSYRTLSRIGLCLIPLLTLACASSTQQDFQQAQMAGQTTSRFRPFVGRQVVVDVSPVSPGGKGMTAAGKLVSADDQWLILWGENGEAFMYPMSRISSIHAMGK